MTMAANPETCGNCGTENPPGQDFCIECGQPLSQSADMEERAEAAAEGHGSLIAGSDEVPGDQTSGLGAPRLPGTADDPPSRRR